ncbi:hypothetical protein ACVW2L_000731 [Mucilaginibacter sp. HD30]
MRLTPAEVSSYGTQLLEQFTIARILGFFLTVKVYKKHLIMCGAQKNYPDEKD